MTYYPDFHVNDEYIHLLARLKKKKKLSSVLIQTVGFICAGISNVGS